MRQPRFPLSHYVQIIDQAISDKMIYNVDFKDQVKYGLGVHFENTLEAIRNQYTYAGRWENLPEGLQNLDYGLMDSDYQYVEGKLAKIKKHVAALDMSSHPYVVRIFNDLTPWIEIAQKVKALKPFIVKGRKPSSNPSSKPARTLDHTGTCPVCGNNQKLRNGVMVMHGYEVKWNSFQGNCFGVGHKPFEVSPEGTLAYVTYLTDTKAYWEKRLVAQKAAMKIEVTKMNQFTRKEEVVTLTPVDRDFEFYKNRNIHTTEANIRHIAKDIEYFTKKAAEWKAAPLPDGNRDHLDAGN